MPVLLVAKVYKPTRPSLPRVCANRSILQRGVWILCLSLLLWILGCRDGQALNLREKYEEQLIRWALKLHKLKLDPKPAGKLIERVVIARENIIAKTDLWPTVLNIIHIKTQEHIVRRELLINHGEIWEEARVKESARNLRGLSILATVRIVACRAKNPDNVIMLVVTRDLWSLRINSSYNQSAFVLKRAEYFPTEMNFLGLGKQLGLHVRLNQLDLSDFSIRDHFALGQFYYDPRLFGSRWQFFQRLDFIIDGKVPCGGAFGAKNDVWCPIENGSAVSGTYAQMSLSRPLYSLASKWAFSIGGVINTRQGRVYRQNNDPSSIPFGEKAGLSLRALPFEHPDGRVRGVPYVYDASNLSFSANVTRSFGRKIKQNVWFGVAAYEQKYTPPKNFPFDQTTERWFQRTILPRNESAYFGFIGYSFFEARYKRIRNIQAFALSEDYRMGPSLSTEIRVAREIAHPSQFFVEGSLSASYRFNFLDDLLTLSVYGAARYQPLLADLGYDAPWANTFFRVSVHNVFPLTWIGRLHVLGYFATRFNDLDRGLYFLGSDTGLRGYASDQFAGQNLVRLNAEFRSLPLNILTLHIGFVLFYDGASVFGGPNPDDPGRELAFQYRHSVGMGIRFQFPQFDKEVLRIDMGIPLSTGGGPPLSWFTFAFRQIF